MNLSEITSTIYLAAADYVVGHTFPLLPIERITLEEVPTPGKRDKSKKAIIYLKGAPKGWVANKQCLREIAIATGESRKIEQAWIGTKVALKVIGDVRRPDGTKGNAFRIASIEVPTTAPAHPDQEPIVITDDTTTATEPKDA